MNSIEKISGDMQVFRIIIARSEEPEVNMVYAEVGKDDYEVFGVFSGMDAGGGLFHQKDSETVVSDDPFEFDSELDSDDVENVFKQLEQLRAEFEEFDDNGEMIGFSKKGLEFLRSGKEDDEGYIEVYSEGASEDFIYDCQDEWNLGFYKN